MLPMGGRAQRVPREHTADAVANQHYERLRVMPSKVSSTVRRLKTRLARGWKPSIGTSTWLLKMSASCASSFLFCCGAAKFIFPRKRKKFFIFATPKLTEYLGDRYSVSGSVLLVIECFFC